MSSRFFCVLLKLLQGDKKFHILTNFLLYLMFTICADISFFEHEQQQRASLRKDSDTHDFWTEIIHTQIPIQIQIGHMETWPKSAWTQYLPYTKYLWKYAYILILANCVHVLLSWCPSSIDLLTVMKQKAINIPA